jgi:hypothetical protein
MLWPGNTPEDQQQRDRFCDAGRAQYVHRLAQTAGELLLTADEIGQLAEAPSPAEVERMIDAPFSAGLLAGRILLEHLHERHTGGPRSLSSVKRDVAEDFKGSDFLKWTKNAGVEPKWQRYRTVAHLWAACQHTTRESALGEMPCGSRAGVIICHGFCLLARELLRLGAAVPTQHGTLPGVQGGVANHRLRVSATARWHVGCTHASSQFALQERPS